MKGSFWWGCLLQVSTEAPSSVPFGNRQPLSISHNETSSVLGWSAVLMNQHAVKQQKISAEVVISVYANFLSAKHLTEWWTWLTKPKPWASVRIILAIKSEIDCSAWGLSQAEDDMLRQDWTRVIKEDLVSLGGGWAGRIFNVET